MLSLKWTINVVKLRNIGDNISTVLKAYWYVHKTAKRNFRIHWMRETEFSIGLGYNFTRYNYWHKMNKVYQYYYVAYQFRYVNISYLDRAKIFDERGFDLQDTKKLGSWNEATNMCKSKGGYLPIIRSKEEQDELMRYMNLVEYTPTVNILYIGLHAYLVSGTLKPKYFSTH